MVGETNTGRDLTRRWVRLAPLTGIAFVVLFFGSVAASSPPKGSASDKAWVAAYATRGKQLQHLTTGYLLVFAGLCLMAFLTTLWTRVAGARSPARTSVLPLVAAGLSAASIAAGGVIMASSSGNKLFGKTPMPNADLLRFEDGLGFAMVAVAGMLAAALAIVCLGVQARSAGVFGTGLFVFSLVVAVLLIGAAAFVPILALLVWLVVVAVVLMRRPATGT